MKSRRKVWELQHQTVCKVVGMAFDLGELKKLARKFGISQTDPLMDHEFALHSTAVHLCGSDNKVSRHIQKSIESKFLRYSRRLSALDARELIEAVTEAKGNADIPLWAVLWDLATRESKDRASVETALFGFIHMLEHRLVRDFWKSAAARTQERAEESSAVDELTRLKRRILDAQTELDRREKIIEQLRLQLEDAKNSPPATIERERLPAWVGPQRIDQADKIERLQMLLDGARSRNQDLEEECTRLRADIDVLARDICRKVCDKFAENEQTDPLSCPCRDFLKRKHVAMVGGIDSLESHYRQLVEHLGGTFQRHHGDCRAGECLIHDCVRRADLVVCPVEVNSHNAVKSVKKLCKKYGVPCCFPRTAGLSGFRTAIEEHFAESEVA